MGAATLTDVSLLDSYETEWRIVCEHSCNVLLEGAVTATDAVLRLLQPHIRAPIVWHWPHAPLDLPSGQTGALILRDAGSLSRDDQRRLFEWLNDTGSRTQVISTTARPLFALVAGGLFDTALHYRLNVLLLSVGTPYH
jgi:Sigma-54 interaction domain